MKVYIMAVERGEAEIIRAVKRVPGRPLIPADIVERVDQEHLRQAEGISAAAIPRCAAPTSSSNRHHAARLAGQLRPGCE